MKKLSFKRDDCRLCHSKKLKLVLKLASTPVADSYVKDPKIKQPLFPLDLLLCMDCGNNQIRDIVDPDILYRNYLYESVSSLGFVKHFQDYAKTVVKKFKPNSSHSLIIDIGSNDGTLLRAFKSHGYKVLGIDPAARIAKEATLSGIETLPEYLSPKLAKKIKQQYGPAEIITTNNVFANVDDLDEFSKSVKEMLAKDGVFIFESFYMPDTVKNMVFDFIEHEHLTYFTVAPLSAFFQKHGLELIDAQRVKTKGGSLRFTVQREGGPRKKSQAINKFIAFEKRIGMHKPALYKTFAKRINKAKSDLIKQISRLKKSKASIIGYGASAQSTSLIYHFSLTDKLDYLVDDFKNKHNTFSPGCHIPVYPSQIIYGRKPEAIIIIAWRYAAPIIARNKKYLQQGGSFITPLPKLKITRLR